MTKKLSVLTFFLIGMGLAACNTMEGAGQDIQRGGEAIEDSANDAK